MGGRRRYSGDIPCPSDPFYNANPSENAARLAYYGMTAMPLEAVDGELLERTCRLHSIRDEIDERQWVTSPLKMVAVDSIGLDSCYVTVKVIAEEDPGVDSLVLRTAVVEDSIYYDSPNGETVLNAMFRKFLSGSDGTAFAIAEGETLDFEFAVELDPAWNVPTISTVAFVQNDDDLSVLQAASTKDRPRAWARYASLKRGDAGTLGLGVGLTGSLINRGTGVDTFAVELDQAT